ncbi:hypothetical protein FOL47_001511, partial [Perkinsus chesapeaki]
MTNRRRRPESIVAARKRKRARDAKIRPIALEEYQKLKARTGHPPMLYYCTEKVDNDQRRTLVVDGDKLEHRDEALKREHPLDRSNQLPSLPISLEAAIGAYKSLPAEEVTRKRREILQAIERRAESLQAEATRLRETMHPDVQKVAGHINIPLLKELLSICEYPDVSLADDMLHGFGVIGDIKVADGVFAPIQEHSPAELSRQELFAKAELEREELISKIQSRSFDPDVWNGTMRETEDGLLEGPLTIEETQGRYGKFVLAQRFPIRQVDKIRLCDDYRRSSTNKAISYGHKISLPSHHTLVETWRKLAKDRPHEQYLLYKCDHANAYRQAPTKPCDAPVQLICIKDTEGQPAVFRHRALSFGSSSSVTSYSRISQGITHLHRILFAAGSMSFIDDYWGAEPQSTAQGAFECWVELNRLLGFKEKASKRVVPTVEAELLGIVVTFSHTKMTISQQGVPVLELLQLNGDYAAAASVTATTLRQYASGLNSYMNFVDVISEITWHEVPYFPPSSQLLTAWLSTFRNANTAANYLSHVRKWAILLREEVGDLYSPLTTAALKGQSKICPGGTRKMKPISLAMLKQIINTNPHSVSVLRGESDEILNAMV